MEQELGRRAAGDWIAAFRAGGDAGDRAVRDLEGYLRGVLGKVARGRLGAEDVDELLQESLTRIVKGLGSFRGESAFPTWAAGIATRVAFTELRRRHAHGPGAGAFQAVEEDAREPAATGTLAPDEEASRQDLLRALERAIATRLTERQRVAILAELRGVPTIEIAERLGTNQNALYKLTHDARKRLRRALLEAGFEADSIHDHAREAAR